MAINDPNAPIPDHEFIPDAVEDQDPQSAVQSQGLKSIVKPMIDSGVRTQDSINPDYNSPIDFLGNAVGAKVGGMMARDAGSLVGNEIGTLGKVTNDIKQAGNVVDAKGVQTPTYGSTNIPNYGKVIVKDIPKQSNGKVIRKMAEGGVIADADFKPDQEPAPQMSQAQVAPFHDPNEINYSGQPHGVIPDSQFVPDDEKFGSTGEQVKAGLEGAAQGLAGPVAPLAEEAFMSALGQSPETTAANMRGREAANPDTHDLSEAGALVGSMFIPGGQGKAAMQAGAKVAEGLNLGGKTAGLASKIGAGAAEGMVSNALLSSGDQVSNMIKNDPNTSLQSAITDVGLSSLLGAGIGGALGTVEPLWSKVFGEKAAQTISDFKGRLVEHSTNPDPVASMTKELQDYFGDNTSHFDEVFGPNGLKAQDIQKVMPQMSNKISDQLTDIGERLDKSLQKLSKDPNLNVLEDTIGKYKSAINGTDDPSTIFNATQELKQQLQEFGKYNKDLSPIAERTFRNTAKDLAFGLRNDLEDSSVWGGAGKRQQAINKAFSDYKPALDDFKSKFTEKVEGQPVVSPGKVSTYINQLEKPGSAIKKEMLQNYLDASQKYRQVIADTHSNLGIPSPLQSSSLNMVNRSFDKLTTGAKLADILIKKGLGDAAGKAMAGLVGGGLGHMVGAGGMGALLGEHTLAPLFNSVLPAIGNSMVKSPVSGAGLKASAEYGTAVSRGLDLIGKASKNLFKSNADILPSYAVPKARDIDKLDKKLQEIQQHPTQVMGAAGDLNHYLPDHSVAANAVSAKATQYLNSIRPNTGKTAPLDTPRKPSSADINAYRRQLAIAQQPLMILKNIKEGSLNSKDLMTIKSLYPDLYNHMTQTLIADLTSHMSKGNPIAYKTRLGLSLFAGQPLDSTMSPPSIIAAQVAGPSNAKANQADQQKKISQSSASGLNKMSKMYSTPGQAAEGDQAKR